MIREDPRFLAAIAEGRTLLSGVDGRVCHLPPFVLAIESRPGPWDALMRHVTTVAFVLSTLHGTLVLVGVIPKLFAVVILGWIVPSVVLRALARRRRATLGDTLVDFEHETVEHMPLVGAGWNEPLAGSTVRVRTSVDRDAPLVVDLSTARGRRVRIGRGPEPAVDRLLALLRSYAVTILRDDRG